MWVMPLVPPLSLTALGGDVVSAVATAGVTAVVVVVGAFVFAIAMLFRRREGARPSAATGLASLTTTANVLLVRADEAVTAGEDELGFAIAQFGEERTRDFAATVATARRRLRESFAIRHTLDDPHPESVQKQRELTLQIIATSERIIADLAGHDRTFASLRSTEVAAPERIESLRSAIAAGEARLAPTAELLERLTADYDASLIAPFARAVTDATAHLEAAATAADAAAAGLSPAGVNAVAELLGGAEDHLHRATQLLDAVVSRDRELGAAQVALGELLASAKRDSAEARAVASTTPDPNSGAVVLEAVGAVEAAASTAGRSARNPVQALDAVGGAVERLDLALAGARNQQARLEHARAALEGTLVSARSQISAVRAFIAVGGRRVGADARTRLAEAERELLVAEAGADPVEALDAARRSVTHARDADALARYDAQR